MPDEEDNGIRSSLRVDRYTWGRGCSGWRLLREPDLDVTEEEMPPWTEEVRHHHEKARQFFYVLSGSLIIEREGELFRVGEREGLEIPPKSGHTVRNESGVTARFLVISQPSTAGDRHDDGAPPPAP